MIFISVNVINLLVKCVFRGGIKLTGNENGDDHTVDGDDTRHDDGNDGLHDRLWPHHRHSGDTGARLGRTVSCAHG